jgi:hypothetical protein
VPLVPLWRCPGFESRYVRNRHRNHTHRPPHPFLETAMVILPLFHVLFLLLFQGLVNAQDKPFITSQHFTNLPSKIFYFDDTTVGRFHLPRTRSVLTVDLGFGLEQSILYHDGIDGQVHVSSDEGKTWFPAKGVDKGEAAAVIEHPFDNTVVRQVNL